MRLLSEMTEEEKERITPETIASSRVDLTENEIRLRIEYLLEKQKKELTECFTEEDYEDFYDYAKEAWAAVDVPVRGCAKEIRECMTLALEKLGISGVKTKADFMKIPKGKVDKWNLKDEVRRIIIGG